MSRTREEAINSYITDMLALEDHIEKALRAQVHDFKDEHPEVVARRPRSSDPPRAERQREPGAHPAAGA